MTEYEKTRLIVIDDNKSIYEDFCKILLANSSSEALDDLESLLFDSPTVEKAAQKNYEIDYAPQGEEGYEKIVEAQTNGNPYLIAFCDMRMPPGWDGLKTIEHIIKKDANIQIVICTAFTDHSFEEITTRLGNNPNILVLKKPFDSIEVRQLANALSEKWILNQKVQLQMDDLLKAKLEAEAANIAKSQFLANISHELRTPLHGILSFSNFGITKADTVSDAKKLSYFEKIHNCGSNLLNLVNVLLDLAKMEAGKMTFNWQKCQFRVLLEEVIDEFSGMCLDRKMKINVNQSEATHELYIDNDKIKQVLRNLISNAIKFSPDESAIGINCEFLDECLRIEVIDHGKGIPKEELVLIFDKFEQSSKIKEATGGTGLGLAISREIIDAHHGKIWAQNNTESGAKFTVILPYELKLKQAS